MATLERVCGNLGLRDARRGTWDRDAGCQIQGQRDTGTLMIIAKVGNQSTFMKMCYSVVNIRFHRPEPHWTPHDVKTKYFLK